MECIYKKQENKTTPTTKLPTTKTSISYRRLKEGNVIICEKIPYLVVGEHENYYFDKECNVYKYIDKKFTKIASKAYIYTDEKFDEIVNEFNDFKNYVTGELEKSKNDYDEFSSYVTNRLVLTDNKIKELQKNLDSALASANDYTDRAILFNNEYIIDQTTKALSTVTVLNYFTGERVSIQEMFDYLAQFHLQNAITYEQIESRQKTVDFIVGLNKPVTEFVLNGGTLIPIS